MKRQFRLYAKRRETKILCLALTLVAWGLWGCGNTCAQSGAVVSPVPATARSFDSVDSKSQQSQSFPESKKLRILAVRLRPGQDLRKGIEELVKTQNVRAGFVLTAVGSLRNATIRLADQAEPANFAGRFEIVSLVGTMGEDGVHLHISVADRAGKTIGGHLVDGCLVYTTAEIVIGDAQGLTFSRELDEQTGYKELRIRRSNYPGASRNDGRRQPR